MKLAPITVTIEHDVTQITANWLDAQAAAWRKAADMAEAEARALRANVDDNEGARP